MMEYQDIHHAIATCYHIDERKKEPTDQPLHNGRAEITHAVDKKLREQAGKWGHLAEEIKLVFPDLLSIRQGRQADDACYSFTLTIVRKEVGNVVFTRELFCRFSLLADYFCIYGQDTLVTTADDRVVYADHQITISPRDIYKLYFVIVRVTVEAIFAALQFLPYQFLQKRITGLRIFPEFLRENQYSSVYQALFTPENITDYKRSGDLLYK